MNTDQVRDLLTLCATYDNRKPNAAVVAEWSEVMETVRYEDATQAVRDYYATLQADPFVKPAHILRGVSEIRRRREEADAKRQAAAGLLPNERRCRWWRRCQCTHSACFDGWMDELEHRTGPGGRDYVFAVRCCRCEEAMPK